MQLPLSGEWKSFEDYTNSLKKKYRSRLRGVMKKSEDINIIQLTKEDLIQYENEIQTLFENVKKNSSFGALTFNSRVFKDFIPLYCPKSKLYGLFFRQKTCWLFFRTDGKQQFILLLHRLRLQIQPRV